MKKFLLSTLVASLLVTGTSAQETTPKNASVKEVKTIALNNAKEKANETSTKVKTVKEAIDSLNYAHEAFIALNKGEKSKALKNIEKALGKLEVKLASKNVPKFLPVYSVVNIEEYIGTSSEIKKIVNLSKELLDDNKVQSAKKILAPLKSEIDIKVLNLPLATYPNALKETAKLIHNNKVDEAKVVLATALNTLVGVETVTPIPLVEATELIAIAAVVTQENTDKAKVYLDEAQEQLRIARYLGYLSESDVTYKALDEAIDKLKSEIRSKEVKSLFKNLQNKIEDFTSKIFSSKDEEKK